MRQQQGIHKEPRSLFGASLMQINRVSAKATAPPGGQIDRPHGYLRGEAERIRGCSAVRDDRFAALRCQAFDHFDGRRRTGAIATLYRSDIDATTRSQQRATPNKAGEHLTHRCPTAQMQQLFADQGSALR